MQKQTFWLIFSNAVEVSE